MDSLFNVVVVALQSEAPNTDNFVVDVVVVVVVVVFAVAVVVVVVVAVAVVVVVLVVVLPHFQPDPFPSTSAEECSR